jgi:hypothetical protein
MWYISGIQALNLPCKLLTCGDWHHFSMNWDRLDLFDSEKSIYSDYGIELNHSVPKHPGSHYVANHIRALLDLLTQGNFFMAQGMNDDFICNDSYTEEIFLKVAELKTFQNWTDIDAFMGREYYSKWLRFKERYGLWLMN